MLTQEHAGAARAFLKDAVRDFAEGDVRQASEKMWGAASHAIMAVAMQRGQDCETRRQIVNVGSQIAEELDDGKLRTGMQAAQRLRENSLHGFMEPYEFARPAGYVRLLVERMLALAG